jgi:plastocyanin/mono/diheme cytochrome c family protein
MNRVFRLFTVGLLFAVIAGAILALTLPNIVGAQPTTTTTAPSTTPNPSVTVPPSTTTSAGSTTTTAPASGTNATQPVPDALPQANASHGQALYNQQCLICHDVDAEGDGPVHTFFIPEPANLTAVRDAPGMAFSIVQNGLPGTAMPAHRNFSQSDFNDIIAYVETKPLDTTREWSNAWSVAKTPDIAKAQSVYYQACADCHGNDGKGGGPWGENAYVWPRPANLTAQSSDIGRTFDIITNGIPGTFMAPQAPKFSEDARYALALYVMGFLNPKSQDTIATGSIGQRTNPYTADNQGAWMDGQMGARFYCEYCHGAEVNGTAIAPQLTDRFWRYDGGTDRALFLLIEQGVPGKLMPPHNVLSEDTRWRIITFIRHRGGLPNPLKVTGTSGNPSALGGASTTTSGSSGGSSESTAGQGAATSNPNQQQGTPTSGGSSTGSSAGMIMPGALTFASTNLQSGLAMTTTNANAVTVEMYNDAFQPANLVVAPGTRVIWINHDATDHTSTMNDWDPEQNSAQQVPGAWDSGPLDPGKSFSAVFTQPGTSMYQCSIHPYMIGSVTVDVSMIGTYSPIGRAGTGLGWWWAAIGVGIVIVLVVLFFAVVWGRWVGRHRAAPPPAAR